MVDLYRQVRLMKTLSSAWRVVRASCMQSSSNTIRNEAIEFEADAIRQLKLIQSKLQKKTFEFLPQHGIAKSRPGKAARPLVIAPIPNRIVQRAILDVLQGNVPYVQGVMNIPTSFGGIKGKNVAQAISAINESFAAGVTNYVRSDIPSFFTKVQRAKVVDALAVHIADVDMVNLFTSAIETTLSNLTDLQRSGLDSIFPLSHDGVAQGSPLSPLIANIYLAEFDREMNSNELICIRYIDDFVIMAASEKLAMKGFRSAKAILGRQGLQVYSPDDDPLKASKGEVRDGFDFLGCYVKPGLVRPSKSARNRLLEKVDAEIKLACNLAAMACKGGGMGAGCYAQAIVNINNIVWGWGKAFRFCTGLQVIGELDAKISKKMNNFEVEIANKLRHADDNVRRKVYGVRMLVDAMDN
jgi:retron-type reverse transcriptase